MSSQSIKQESISPLSSIVNLNASPPSCHFSSNGSADDVASSSDDIAPVGESQLLREHYQELLEEVQYERAIRDEEWLRGIEEQARIIEARASTSQELSSVQKGKRKSVSWEDDISDFDEESFYKRQRLSVDVDDKHNGKKTSRLFRFEVPENVRSMKLSFELGV